MTAEWSAIGARLATTGPIITWFARRTSTGALVADQISAVSRTSHVADVTGPTRRTRCTRAIHAITGIRHAVRATEETAFWSKMPRLAVDAFPRNSITSILVAVSRT